VPQARHAGARWKQLPVRLRDARCPPTMPFPAEPGKDSRFIGRDGMELVHAKAGNRPFVNVTAAARGWDDHSSRDRAVTPCRPKDSKNPLSEAFLRRNFAQCGISAIIEARREDPAAYLRAYVALLVLPGWRARARVRKQILAGAPRDISSPPTGAGSTSVGHQDFVLLRRLDGKG
jgi:hypothetical protein